MGKLILPLLCAALAFSGCTPVPTRTNSPDQLDKPYLILISIDGYRWDYIDRFPTPAINQLVSDGVRAEKLIPVFPTQTFPNHYTLATGLYPSHHGIVANIFPDRSTGRWYEYKNPESSGDGSWYGGEPIWVAAEKVGMLSASYFFIGSEAEIQGVRPTHWYPFNGEVSGKKRVSQLLRWMKLPPDQRPHMYTLYFEEVDVNSHRYGPLSGENQAAIARVDGYIQQLLNGLSKLSYADQVNIVLVSDHGQSTYDANKSPFVISEHLDLEGIESVDGGTSVFLYFDHPDPQRAIAVREGINMAWDCGQAYLPGDIPKAWRISISPRTADVFIIADPGCGVLSSPDRSFVINEGAHGWAPETPEMNGIFVATGPGLPQGTQIGPVNAIDVYPFMLELLGLPPNPEVDGDPDVLIPLIKQ
jgi:predicted AlkP superfamily pyrophosphatase or phosphodiesterase